MRQKLFTKEIDKKLFEQYPKGSDLKNQVVVAKLFNPYGRGTWYLINSDPQDPDYLWAIVDLFEVETGSVSRKELESIRVKPFNLGLERDLSFRPVNAEELIKGLREGKHYGKGGLLDSDNLKKYESVANGLVQENKYLKDLVHKIDSLDDDNYLQNKGSITGFRGFEKGGKLSVDEMIDTLDSELLGIKKRAEGGKASDFDYSAEELEYYEENPQIKLPEFKKGGKAKKYADGGKLKDEYKTLFHKKISETTSPDFDSLVLKLKELGYNTNKMWEDMWLKNELTDISQYHKSFVPSTVTIKTKETTSWSYTIGGL